MHLKLINIKAFIYYKFIIAMSKVKDFGIKLFLIKIIVSKYYYYIYKIFIKKTN